MGYFLKTFVDMIPNKVKINGNVFHAGVENRIYTEMSSTNIVTHNDRRLLQRDTKFSEK
jgi:hypothetical protein